MLNEREMKYRLKCAEDAHIPMTNYGILRIAYMNGIFEPEHLYSFEDIVGLKGNLNLVTDYIVCSSFTRKHLRVLFCKEINVSNSV